MWAIYYQIMIIQNCTCAALGICSGLIFTFKTYNWNALIAHVNLQKAEVLYIMNLDVVFRDKVISWIWIWLQVQTHVYAVCENQTNKNKTN